MVEKVSVDKIKDPNDSVHITFKAKLFRNLLQFGNTDVMRRQVLNISSVEFLAQFYKVKIVFFKLPLLDWFLLARIVPKLQCASTLSCFPGETCRVADWYLLAIKVCENEHLS